MADSAVTANKVKIAKLEEKFNYLATKEDLERARAETRDLFTELSHQLGDLFEKIEGLVTTNGDVQTRIKSIEAKQSIEAGKNIAQDEKLNQLTDQVTRLAGLLEDHTTNHPRRFAKEFEFSIFNSSRARKIALIVLGIFLYVMTIYEVRQAVLDQIVIIIRGVIPS